jgi:hypothetical protein
MTKKLTKKINGTVPAKNFTSIARAQNVSVEGPATFLITRSNYVKV